MSRKRERTTRQFHVRVRTVRRDPIDYDALARAALEQAAMNESPDQDHHGEPPRKASTRPPISTSPLGRKERRHDRLA